MVTSFIALGSNQQQPKNQLLIALESIASINKCKLIKQSSFYKSTPLCMDGSETTENDYINAVVKIETHLYPFELLKALQQIENNQGRVRQHQNRWAARTLDLDILLYNDKVIQTQQLIIPHYAMKNRDFVLQPLLEIATEYVLPDGSEVSKLLSQCNHNHLTKIKIAGRVI